MLCRLSQLTEECLDSAAEARRRSKEATDKEIKASYAAIEKQWSRLAENYKFLEETSGSFNNSSSDQVSDQLNSLISIVTQYSSNEARSAFFAVSKCGTKLRHITGMHESYARAVDRLPIGPTSLGCGLAVSIKEFVLHPDVFADPRWEPWLELAAIGEFRSCWSFPVDDNSGQTIGTFAMYFKAPRRATVRDLDFATTVARCGGVILASNPSLQLRQRS